jgi:zinc D-Ala-D-Ala carboxypeptidase
MEAISKHISWREATQSPTATKLGIKNIPNAEELQSMKEVAEMVFEPLRSWYGKPIKINSFFRNEALNRAVKGARNSDHKFGCAIDISAGSKAENKKLFDWIKDNLEFNQLINEYDFTWVHVSYRKNKNKNQILIIK